MLAKEINSLTTGVLVVWALCFAQIFFEIAMMNTVWKRPVYITLPPNNRKLWLIETNPPMGYQAFAFFIAFGTSSCFPILSYVYSRRVFRKNKYSPTTTQRWVRALLVTTAFYLNPIVLFPTTNKAWFKYPAFNVYYVLCFFSRSLGGTISNCGWIWCVAHSYALDRMPSSREGRISFYAPKLIPLALFQVMSWAAIYPFKLGVEQIPFTNIVAMIVHGRTVGIWYKDNIIFLSVYTAVELYLFCCILFRATKTAKILRDSDYIVTRSRQIGFRWFCFANIVFYVLVICADIIVKLGISRFHQIRMLLDYRVPAYMQHHYYRNNYSKSAIDLMILVNAYLTAFVTLPPDSRGFRGWFHPTYDEKCNEAEPLSLSTSERNIFQSKDQEAQASVSSRKSHFHFNSLVLQTHVDLLNFSWLAYSWSKTDFSEDMQQGEIAYQVHDYIQDPHQDTKLLIATSNDRIILAFKGTTSWSNIKTDLQVAMVPLAEAVPMIESIQPSTNNTELWDKARVHSGFVEAYKPVRRRILECVSALLEKTRRPVFLTGHSLGGALATICCIDLRANLDLEEDDVLVSTFGSPRVGNVAWANLFDQHVPGHWRFTLERDVVTMMPRFGYRHCGKRVLITASRNIFLDPNSLEGALWTGEVASMSFHKKPAYLLGIRAFCRKRMDDYEPNFWRFPIGTDVTQKWESQTATNLGKY